MDGKLTQAIGLFNSGKKREAAIILEEIVRNDPKNSIAWYGLALCQTEKEKTIEYLKKATSFDPDNEKARKLLEKIDSSNAQENKSTVNRIDTPKNSKRSTTWIPYVLILLLSLVIAWLFIRLDKQEKKLNEAADQITSLESNINSINSQIKKINLQIDNINLQNQTLNSHIVKIDTAIINLETDLSYTTALAENANRYAHSHSYSDEQLKTDVKPVNNALQGILLLEGVSFNWTSSARSELNLPNDPQIGLIAQDVEKVFPELVSIDIHGYKQVDYPKLTVFLIEAIKEQQKMINDLWFQINDK